MFKRNKFSNLCINTIEYAKYKNQEMNWSRKIQAAVVIWVAGSSQVMAQGYEKNGGMRDLETDRPDATESPISVDRGHFQLEAGLVTWSRDESGSDVVESWSLGEMNIKYGLTDSMDAQLIIVPSERVRTVTGNQETELEGVSDLTLRLKKNVWGNDGGSTAFGLLPYVTIPSGSEVSTKTGGAGLVTPFSWNIGENWGLGTQVELAYEWNDEESDHTFNVTHTCVLGFDVTDQFGFYLEHILSAGDHRLESSASFGITFLVNKFLQWDAGSIVGLTDSANDVLAFTGFSWKY